MHPILHQLDQQWSELTSSPEARHAVERWSANHPAMRDMADLHDVIRSRRVRGLANEVQHALAELASSDELAGWTLLQILLPGLVRVSVSAGYDDPDAIDEVITLAWERIRTYPPARPGSVAGNVLLDVRKRYLKGHLGVRSVSLEVVREVPSTASLPEDRALVTLQLEQLRDARDQGMVSDVAFEAIVRTRVQGYSLAEVAAQNDMSTRVIYDRRWRAERRLRELASAA